jgi:hypothetical protein
MDESTSDIKDLMHCHLQLSLYSLSVVKPRIAREDINCLRLRKCLLPRHAACLKVTRRM